MAGEVRTHEIIDRPRLEHNESLLGVDLLRNRVESYDDVVVNSIDAKLPRKHPLMTPISQVGRAKRPIPFVAARVLRQYPV